MIYGMILFYFVFMIGISIAISKKIKNKTDFFVAGRNLPLWLCTATLTATWFGGGTVLGAAGAALGGGGGSLAEEAIEGLNVIRWEWRGSYVGNVS